MQLILVQLFWLSFVIIGSAVVVALRRFAAKGRLSKLIYELSQIHPLVDIFHRFLLGILLMATITTPLYIIGGATNIAVCLYATFVTISIGLFVYERRVVVQDMQSWLQGIGHSRLLVLVVLSALAFDFVHALQFAPHLLTGDAWVHIAKINQMVAGKISITDPYFGYNGVVDPRYSANLMHALMAVGAKLLHMSATNFWLYSVGLFRLIIWLSFFLLLKIVLPKRVQPVWPYAVLGLLPFFDPVFFSTALYPDRIALAWTAVVLAGLLLIDRAYGVYLFMVGCVLVALTHSLNAAMLAAFLVFLSGAYVLSRQMNKYLARVLVCGFLICLAPVSWNLYYPNLSSLNERARSALPISGKNIELIKFHSFEIAKLPVRDLLQVGLLLLAVVALWVIYTRRPIGRPWLRLTLGFLLVVTALLSYSPAVFGFLGLGFIFISQASKKRKILVACATTFYALIIYNPIALSVALPHLPVWGIARFRELNVLGNVAPIVGLFALLSWVLQSTKNFRGRQYFTVVLAAGLFIIFLPFPYRLGFWPTQGNRAEETLLFNRQAELLRVQQKVTGLTFTGRNEELPSLLVGTVSTNVLNLNEYAAAPMANTSLRAICSKRLVATLTQEDLVAAGVHTLLLDKNTDASTIMIADTKQYLRLAAAEKYYRIYTVSDQITAGPSTCKIPYRQ